MNNLQGMTDEMLAMLYIEGNNKAFDILLNRNKSKLFSYIMFVVRDEEMANDIFQETFVKVITRLHEGRYAPTGKFSAWLTRIAHNVIMDWYRDYRSQNIVDASEDNDLSRFSSDNIMELNVENEFVNTQVMTDVRRLMEELPPTQREVVYMRFFQELSFKEIAESTGVSINTALGRMRYAVLNLRRMAKTHHVILELD